MALDAYSPCPCGSGKKFKWCCQPIHVQIDKAFHLEEEGQHDAALRVMDEVIAENPANPEAYGRKAQLLYQNQKVEEAEETLQKALAINPGYPFGYFLRGVFRQNEGEIPGALILFRKAAELYDPEAHDYLGQIYALMFEAEFHQNHPVAAHAALKIALRYQPASENLRQAEEKVFGASSRLPACARREYTFQSPPAGVSAERRKAWDQALASTAKLSDAVRAFEQLTQQNSADAAAWYNLGLARTWLGQNRPALEALDQYVAHEKDEQRAAEAWTLAGVLRCGQDMEDVADYLEQSVTFQIREPQAFFQVMSEWERERRFIPVEINQEQGLITGMVLEKKPNLTPELAATQMAALASYVLIIGGHVRLWHTNPASLADVREELQQRAGPALATVRSEQGVANFNDLLADAIAFPLQAGSQEEAERRINEHIERFFEEKWIHRPLKSLNGIPPIDAAGHAVLRKKLRGDVQFLQDVAAFTQAAKYDFDRLRNKLGLLGSAPAPTGTTGPDIGAMSAADLASLADEKLTNEELEQAYQTAMKLDARDLAGRFARGLVVRPRTERPLDRYPWYAHLIQLAQADGDLDSALNYVNGGEKADCEENEGRRRNDYELRRAQLLAKRGDADQAQDVFERLIQRVPSESRYRGSAAEAMLSAKQGAKALRFAEGGLAKAREKNDRDSEQYFMELVEAAKRLVGKG